MLRHTAVATLDERLGPRNWWWVRTEGFPMWVVLHVPKRVPRWTLIRVYAKDGRRR